MTIRPVFENQCLVSVISNLRLAVFKFVTEPQPGQLHQGYGTASQGTAQVDYKWSYHTAEK